MLGPRVCPHAGPYPLKYGVWGNENLNVSSKRRDVEGFVRKL